MVPISASSDIRRMGLETQLLSYGMFFFFFHPSVFKCFYTDCLFLLRCTTTPLLARRRDVGCFLMLIFYSASQKTAQERYVRFPPFFSVFFLLIIFLILATTCMGITMTITHHHHTQKRERTGSRRRAPYLFFLFIYTIVLMIIFK